ncbi:ribonuclease III [Noviherbaspirillum malthae]|uniref:ribonuclease III n=1 Tax=Noviherbaspirillum malthae TaxID=1260987 RepID=UPI0018902C2E|nr:ribonuclease III [Noviherbaspirillum malthae]
MDELEQQLGYVFKDKGNLATALTHKSCGAANNERLEFLGDSILNFVAADLIFEKFPKLPEGEMSRLRANLVREETLARIAGRLALPQSLKCVELTPGSVARATAFADALEAIFAAIYKEAGYEIARAVIRRQLITVLRNGEATLVKDAKTRLQELLQAFGHPLPKYEVVRTNEIGAEELRFEVACSVEVLRINTIGFGRTRKAAEFEAAQKAVKLVQSHRL